MKKSTFKIIMKTLPFIGIRTAMYGGFALLSILWILLFFWLANYLGEYGVFVFLLFGLGGQSGLLKLAKHYLFYFIKAAHMAVVVELLETGQLPEGGQVRFGIAEVKKHIGTTSITATLDMVIRKAVRQIMRLLSRVEGAMEIIPGLSAVFQLLNSIISVACNYIDECILGYIMMKKKKTIEKNTWEVAADGIVIYAQNWQTMGKSATKSVVYIFILRFSITVLSFIGIIVISILIGFIPALVIVLGIAWAINRAFVDPVITVTMFTDYYGIVESDPEPEIYYREYLKKGSSQFRKLLSRVNGQKKNAPLSGVVNENV